MNRLHLSAWVVTSVLLNALLYTRPIVAQVIPDATLPAGEQSQVTGNTNVQIDGGARRGGALFHSFSEFSIPTGGSAFFNNAADVQTILSRVTGGSLSNIDGLIRANGTANLFFLNPNGILFGPNAQLNIGGSFVATTANAIGFPNGEIFSSDVAQPLPSQLLNVNPNALFFNQLTAQAIVNQSTANNGIGLQVPAGRSLLLVGGDVRLEGGQILSPGSRVELGAVAGQGTVGLSITAGDWRLSFPNGIARADVSLSNRAAIDVLGREGGSISITARNLTLNQGSTIWAGIREGLGFAGAQAGDIELDATEAISLAQGSVIGSRVGFGSTGNAGNITITTGSFSVTEAAQIGSSTFGQGNAGSVTINARDTVAWDGDGVIGGTAVEPTGVGNAGDFNITTGSLSITNGARLGSVTRGQGNTGGVNIVARDTISIEGYDYFYSFIGSGVDLTGVGNSGDINITTGSLLLTNAAAISAYTNGRGNAGGVNVNAYSRVVLDGTGVSLSQVISGLGNGIASSVYAGGIGNSSGINITTGSLSLTNFALLTSGVVGQGEAGSININARDTVSLENRSTVFSSLNPTGVGRGGDINITTRLLSLTGGSQLVSSTFGRGDAGNVNVNAHDTIFIDGEDPIAENSAIFTQVNPGAVGQGGDINLVTGSLFLTNGGALYADNDSGTGNAGDIVIRARDSIEIRGTAPTLTHLRSGVFATTPQGVVGRGGDISITTGSLSVSDQGRISTRAQGLGSAGDIHIQASDAVLFNGGDAISTLDPGGVGRGGDIEVAARSLSLLNGAQLSSTTAGEGDAGNITVSTPDLQVSGATSGLFAQTTSTGNAGNLTIQPRDNEQSVRVNLQNGAQISASTLSSGRGGELTISAPESITLTGNGSVIAAGTGSSGASGNLNLRTATLSIQNQAEVTVSSSGTGIAGNLFVDANRIYLNNQASIRADTSGGGGNIELRSPLIVLRNGSNISTNAKGENIPGGNIAIDTRFLIAVLTEDSNISANSEDFRGGNVSINAFSIFGIQPSLAPTPLSDITATGATTALAGTIDITTAGFDPTAGLVVLPTNLADPGLIAQGCPANEGNSFVITGRGGLSPTPEQQLDDDAEWQDRRRLFVSGREGHGDAETPRHGEFVTTPHRVLHRPIIEATGWQTTPTGDVILVAATANSVVQNSLHQSVTCSGKQ